MPSRPFCGGCAVSSPLHRWGGSESERPSCPEGTGQGGRSSPEPLPLTVRLYVPAAPAGASSNFRAWLPGSCALLRPRRTLPSHAGLGLRLCQTVSSHACPAQTVPSGGKRPSPHGPSSACMLLFVLLFCDRPRVGTERLFAHSVSTAPAPSASALMCMGLASSFRFRSGQVTQALPIAH